MSNIFLTDTNVVFGFEFPKMLLFSPSAMTARTILQAVEVVIELV